MEPAPLNLRYRGNRLKVSPPNIGCFYSVFFGGYYDPLVDRLGPNDVVVDGGANFGAFTTLVSPRVKQVYSIEPNPENFELLKQNVDNNRLTNVTAINAALADKVGESLFEGRGEEGHLAGHGLPVKTITLDSLGPNPPSAIKLDIEGAEVIAVRGQKTVARVHSIAFELDENALGRFRHHPSYESFPENTYSALKHELASQGFRITEYGSTDLDILSKLFSWDLVRAELRTKFHGARFGLDHLLRMRENVLRPHSYQDLSMVYAFR
jgi:FkbM family methyltransferase